MKRTNTATTRNLRRLSGACLVLAGALLASQARAATSDYATISLTGSAADFTGVPDAYTNTLSSGDLPISAVQIANDGSNLYVGITYSSAINPDSLADGGQETIALDNDANASTGFDIFGAGTVGSEVGFAYDYPFQETSSDYNTGVDGITEYGGDFASTVNYDPYDASTSFEEFDISLADTYTVGSTTYAVFPNSSFALAFYDSDSSTGFTGPIEYSVASAPEPRVWNLMLGGLACLAGVARWRRASAR